MQILLVDDERIALRKLERVVQQVLPGYNCHSFLHADEAMRFAQTQTIDLALLDIEMRGTNGLEMAKGLQQRNPRVNVIFCTGYSSYAMDAFDLYCSGYLVKPVTAEQLRKAIEHLRYPLETGTADLTVQCFGNFEVFANGRPVRFRYHRTKELLAYLVDQKGRLCTREEICMTLFEGDGHSSYFYRMKSDLLQTLEDLGASDVLVQTRGGLGVARDRLHCDYYDYLDGRITRPRNEYMSQYSFAEITHSSLLFQEEYPPQ